MSFRVIIPARYGAARLPGKPLLDIAGKPLIAHVCERASASGAASVTVATDDARIAAAVRASGYEVVMTAASHRSGTDRLAEAVSLLGFDDSTVVVNVQGDEPLIPPAVVAQVAALLATGDAPMATLCWPGEAGEAHDDPAIVKVVSDASGHALYFSRAPIPFDRDAIGVPWQRHIGLYAYRAGYLAQFCARPPSPAEQAEQLEQLRALHYGDRIRIARACELPPPGVDTPADLARVRAVLAG